MNKNNTDMKPQARQFINSNLSIDYDTTLFEKGVEWLENFWFGNYKAVQIMSYNPLFWNWWANQWRIRTKECIYNNGFDLDETDLLDYEKELLTEAYHTTHDIKNSQHIYPTEGMRDLMLQIKNDLKTA